MKKYIEPDVLVDKEKIKIVKRKIIEFERKYPGIAMRLLAYNYELVVKRIKLERALDEAYK